MNGEIVIANGVPLVGTAVAGELGGEEDPFEVFFRPAKPTLDAAIEMWKALRWLDRQRRSRLPLFDPKRAAELIELIPAGNRIAKAGPLFRAAEEEAAPEAWVHVVIGLMMRSTPAAANLGDTFRCGLVDSMYRDPEVWGDYQPGYSAPVIVRTIREIRRQDSAPSPARFLAACAKHRAQFKQWNSDTGTLLSLRYEAEDALEQLQAPRLALTHFDDEMDIPF